MEATLALSADEIERGKPMPSKNHAIVQSNLLFQLRIHFGDMFTILPELTIDFLIRDGVPDLAIYKQVIFTPGEDEVVMTEIPLGLIEILSPQQGLQELMQKRKEYFNAGVSSYWLVIPDLLTIYVYYSVEDYDVFTRQEPLFDKKLNIELSLAEIFR